MEQFEFIQQLELTKDPLRDRNISKEIFIELPLVYNLSYQRIKFLNIVQQNDINLFGISFKFSDNLWDFSDLWEVQKKKSNYKFKFIEIPDNYLNMTIFKIYMIERINRYHITGGNNLGCMTTINELLGLMSEKNIQKIEDITVYHFSEYFYQKNITYSTTVKKKYYLLNFIKFYSHLMGIDINVEIYKFLKERNQNKINAQIEANKTLFLPKEFYNKFVETLEMEIKKGKRNKYVLGKYALILIATQTGLRLSGLRLLDVDCLELENLNGYQVYKIGLPITKKRPGNSEKVRYMKANPKIVFAVNYLINVFEEERLVSNSKALYVGKMYKRNLVTITQLSECIYEFCQKHLSELEIVNRVDNSHFEKNIMVKDLKDRDNLVKKFGLNPTDIISMPTSTQFRVFVASELFERGLSTFEISYLMGHDTLAFADHYIRPKDILMQDMLIGTKKIIEIVDNDLNIIGPSGDLYTRKLKEFFKKNGKANVIEISEKFQNQFPIRAKNGGFCIKPVGRDCIYDQNSNEFLCSFRICPNHHHLFNEIVQTYTRCDEMFSIVIFNQKNGFRQESQKQLSILKSIIFDDLDPEIRELKLEIHRKGVEKLLQKFPEIKSIILNLDSVEREAQLWKNYSLE